MTIPTNWVTQEDLRTALHDTEERLKVQIHAAVSEGLKQAIQQHDVKQVKRMQQMYARLNGKIADETTARSGAMDILQTQVMLRLDAIAGQVAQINQTTSKLAGAMEQWDETQRTTQRHVEALATKARDTAARVQDLEKFDMRLTHELENVTVALYGTDSTRGVQPGLFDSIRAQTEKIDKALEMLSGHSVWIEGQKKAERERVARWGKRKRAIMGIVRTLATSRLTAVMVLGALATLGVAVWPQLEAIIEVILGG